MSKYHNTRTEVDGITFASKHEAYRYIELKYLQRTGQIKDLQIQRAFVLIGAQKDENGQIIEHPVKYVADFCYKDKDGKTVVEDAKSPATRTDVYVLKRKLMLSIYGIRIQEV